MTNKQKTEAYSEWRKWFDSVYQQGFRDGYWFALHSMEKSIETLKQKESEITFEGNKESDSE